MRYIHDEGAAAWRRQERGQGRGTEEVHRRKQKPRKLGAPRKGASWIVSKVVASKRMRPEKNVIISCVDSDLPGIIWVFTQFNVILRGHGFSVTRDSNNGNSYLLNACYLPGSKLYVLYEPFHSVLTITPELVKCQLPFNDE